ncbi:Cytochrome c oxidase polypeptide III [Rhodovastum atsumiense]|uniref:Cytochrome C oxidase subunit III n=1 Tax=Rhodovastum atsumiense TaxID=504468 RepID=A0A5M6J0V3_9PROT|nr:cytochrome c oxidase subunit 3 [Rhodovastum atsumiense]KAA5613248.1 cytochrome C oxidase subunit III [Rhodovastum atsumiense]CAH2600594.1 Cytochrome c oxidase polypeptide III [Rhodovastum atsumiense]
MPERLGPHHQFQFESPAHQADTAIAGMWLFLATEALFFGGLFLAFIFCRHQHPAGFDLAARHTKLWIGAVNTALLLTSSAVMAAAPVLAGHGRGRQVRWICAVTAAFGIAFLALKGVEWKGDFDEHLWPGPDFALAREAGGGAALFFAFYFVATGLHGLHMLIGLGLLTWLGLRARAGALDGGHAVPAEVVGLYWSFVDMIWVVLFPLIYLLGRVGA